MNTDEASFKKCLWWTGYADEPHFTDEFRYSITDTYQHERILPERMFSEKGAGKQ